VFAELEDEPVQLGGVDANSRGLVVSVRKVPVVDSEFRQLGGLRGQVQNLDTDPMRTWSVPPVIFGDIAALAHGLDDFDAGTASQAGPEPGSARAKAGHRLDPAVHLPTQIALKAAAGLVEVGHDE
jgi:hypothetical protein